VQLTQVYLENGNPKQPTNHLENGVMDWR